MPNPQRPFQLWLAFLIAYFCICACSLTAKANPAELKERVAQLIAAEKIPHASAAVLFINEGAVVLKDGFGYANFEAKAPVTEKTLFAIGSCTKAFTGLGLKLLEQEGKISLADSVRGHLPRFGLLRSELNDQVTLEDLLAHRVSLPRHDLFWYLADLNRYQLFDRLPYLPFAKDESYQFRKRFVYNNLMYVTAGLVTESVSGTTWENFTQQRILNPLGMTETGVRLDLAPAGSVAATPYVNGEPVDFNLLENAAPAGSIYSNLNDMEKWIRFHLAKGAPLLSEEAWRDLFRERISLESEGSPGVGYGLGWASVQREGLGTIVTHSGSIDGFSAYVLFIPERQLGVVVLINHLAAGELASNIARELILAAKQKGTELMLFQEPVATLTFPSLFSRTLNASESPSADLSGVYNHPGYGDLIVSKAAQGWTYRFWRATGSILPKENGTYTLEIKLPIAQGEAPIEVETADGLATAIKVPLEPMSAPISFERVKKQNLDTLLAAPACQQEAQLIATVSAVETAKDSCVLRLDSSSYRHFAPSYVCPLGLGEVSFEGVRAPLVNGSCPTKAGDEISGVAYRNTAGEIWLE